MVHFSTCFIYEKHHHTCKGTHFFHKHGVFCVILLKKTQQTFLFMKKKHYLCIYKKLKVFPTFDTYYSLTR